MKELGLGEDPSTLKVTFSLAGTSDWYRTLGDYLQQVYKTELGVEVQIDFSEWDLFYDNVQKGNYQIGFMRLLKPPFAVIKEGSQIRFDGEDVLAMSGSAKRKSRPGSPSCWRRSA